MNSGIERFVAWFSTPRTIFPLCRSVGVFSVYFFSSRVCRRLFSAVSLIVNWNAKYKTHLKFFFSGFSVEEKRATRCANRPYTIWYIIENVWLVSSSSSLSTFFPFRSKLIHRFVLNILNAAELNETKLLFFLAHWMLKFTWMNIHLVSLQSLSIPRIYLTARDCWIRFSFISKLSVQHKNVTRQITAQFTLHHIWHEALVML